MLWRDLLYAGRSLTRARAFTLVCVVSLGIGMAPVVAILYASLAFNTLMTPPSIRPEGLVEVFTTALGPRQAVNNWSYPDFADLRAAQTGLTLTGWTNGVSQHAIETPRGAEAQPVTTKFVSANYFSTFGITLARGAGFDDGMDDPLRTEPVVVVGYDFWQNRLGANPDVVGTRLTLDGVPHIVVGVAPQLAFDERQLFLPLERHPLLRDRAAESERVRLDRDQEWMHVHGRLSPGTDIAQARAAVAVVTSRLASQFPSTNQFRAGAVEAYDPVGVLQRPQFRLLQAVALTLTGVVLLVVSLNISGMMTVRYAMRERELSIRQAIGAGRRRLMQGLLAEALILAGLGGALAAFVLVNVPPTVAWMSGQVIPVQFQDALKVGPLMVAGCVVLCLVTSLMCGLLPALRFSRPAIISSLKDEAGAGGLRAGRVHRVTAALQVAIAVPLIVMAGISLDRIRATAMNDLGFDADALYGAPMRFADDAGETATFRIRAAQDSLARTSGVASVTVADGLPLDFNGRGNRVALETAADVAPQFVPVHVTRVGDRYLDTLGIPLVRGRALAADDRAGGELVTVVSSALAGQLLPDEDVAGIIGRRLVIGADERTRQVVTVVGVTADFPTSQMSTERRQLLLPMAQHPSNHVFLVARSAPGASADQLAAALENAIGDLAPEARSIATPDGVAYASIVTGVWLRENSKRDFLTQSTVAGVAGGVILTLSALGIYGVVGLMVATRTRELAVRVALGASRRRVVHLILFDVIKLVLPGIGIGLLLTVALMRLNSENMGIPLSSVENLAYVLGAAVALLVAVLASLGPARRAASVQPIIAMRAQ
jgi:putative ABC transport system permease protein